MVLGPSVELALQVNSCILKVLDHDIEADFLL